MQADSLAINATSIRSYHHRAFKERNTSNATGLLQRGSKKGVVECRWGIMGK